ncbi:dipeptidase [Deinococcus fonticola]|uniref:dipeptidase n=1 Tax=Deinococcus fonticola TaxID=2528713 RepID=UPI0010757A0E|nr:membrane dipeptidase [Deinococcus fonticola]
MQQRPWLIDGHLDLAYNALEGRDLRLTLSELRAADPLAQVAEGAGQRATVTFGELQAAGARLVFGTIFSMPQAKNSMSGATLPGYTDHAGARLQGLQNLEVYQRWEDQGLIRILKTRQAVAQHLDTWTPQAPLGVVLLMEGADPIRDADDLPFWVECGVRLIGPAWQKTRFAGGTATPGPLSDLGQELIRAMHDLQLTMDASHLDDAAFWDAAEIGVQMIASHSNTRTLVDGNRHLTDEMVRAIAEHGGMIGLVFCNSFIKRGWKRGEPRPTLSDLAAHTQHYAGLIGWQRLGLGTDMDGGFGAEGSPDPIETYRDVPRFLETIPAEHREDVAHGNWERWLREKF